MRAWPLAGIRSSPAALVMPGRRAASGSRTSGYGVRDNDTLSDCPTTLCFLSRDPCMCFDTLKPPQLLQTLNRRERWTGNSWALPGAEAFFGPHLTAPNGDSFLRSAPRGVVGRAPGAHAAARPNRDADHARERTCARGPGHADVRATAAASRHHTGATASSRCPCVSAA